MRIVALMLLLMAWESLSMSSVAREVVDRIYESGIVCKEAMLVPRKIDWDRMPERLRPKTNERLDAQRKHRASVEAFATVVGDMRSPDGAKFAFADVCAGEGDLALPLAWQLGDLSGETIECLAVDIDDRARLKLGEKVRDDDNIKVKTLCADVATLPEEDFEVIVALRACGAVADLAIRSAVLAKKSFVVSPCCLWKAMIPRTTEDLSSSAFFGAGRPSDLDYPRSRWLGSRLSNSEFQLVAAADDSSAARSSASLGGPRTPLYRRARRLVEHDRLAFAEENEAYVTRLLRFPGSDNDLTGLLLGAPQGSNAADAINNLHTIEHVS